MNIYILNATSLGKIAAEILCKNLDVKGFITLNEEVGKDCTNEYYDYRSFCEKQGIDYIGVESYNLRKDSDIERISGLEIDLLLVTSWQRLLPDWLIEQCKIGVIGSHGSAEGITEGRGRSPQNWALLLGKQHFFISIFWIDAGIDSGKIIDTEKFLIASTDDIFVSYIKVNILIADMILRNYKNGKIQNHEGDIQEKKGRYLPKRVPEDGKIDWNRSCNEVYNFIRALGKPYPGAYTTKQGEQFVIWRAKPVDILKGYEQRAIGEVVSVIEGQLLVKCQEGFLLIEEGENIRKCSEGDIFESSNYFKQLQEIKDRHCKNYGMLPIAQMIWDEIDYVSKREV